MHDAEVCTPSARSIRILEGGLPSTVHVMFSDSPSAKRRSSMCALAVGPSSVSTDAVIRIPSEMPGSKNLSRIRHHTGLSESIGSRRSVTFLVVKPRPCITSPVCLYTALLIDRAAWLLFLKTPTASCQRHRRASYVHSQAPRSSSCDV